MLTGAMRCLQGIFWFHMTPRSERWATPWQRCKTVFWAFIILVRAASPRVDPNPRLIPSVIARWVPLSWWRGCTPVSRALWTVCHFFGNFKCDGLAPRAGYKSGEFATPFTCANQGLS